MYKKDVVAIYKHRCNKLISTFSYVLKKYVLASPFSFIFKDPVFYFVCF
jgi:hypothetical protein